ncbi:MAG: Glu-tRNA(Gln) amidotransferase subunit GatD [Candidatus Micrarchaeota archaeon]|nr:Glu-tRNA(Gln) amidotransferase subunit GatD [Candidatus Micrarchaeota archaeon]MCX8154454.1 Glu-tRNA(Gln) amidotransferase subunit GatD [Candidatus Micrarchaeota archaeon]
MKRIKFRWRDREREGILVNDTGEFLEIKLKNGYNIVLGREEVELIEEENIQTHRPEIVEENGEYSVIMTGGTIMSRVDYVTGAVYPSYDLSGIIQRPSKKIFLSEIKFSEAMEPKDWQEISQLCYRELKDGKRVIVLHGTDTMTYSASAVAFAIRDMNSPVVFVGAQRSSDRPSSDQNLNIRGAFAVADTDIGESVIVMHDTLSDRSVGIFRGVRTRKSHSSRRDAFRAIGQGKIGRILYPEEKVVINQNYRKISELGELKNRFSYDVGILYFYPGMGEDVLEYFAQRFKGIVLVGTGLGHVSPKLIPKIGEHRDKIFVITTQTIEGRVNLNVYRTGREILNAGVLGNLTDILPEVAYVKLSWMLGNNIPRESYSENIVGEITERSIYSSGA